MVQGKTSVRLNNVDFDTAVDAIVKTSGWRCAAIRTHLRGHARRIQRH